MSFEVDHLKHQILFAMLTPMARFAMRFGMRMKDVREMSEEAYYREARRRKLKMKVIEEVMSISMSKAATLSKRLKKRFANQTKSSEGQERANVERRIMALLWAEPLTEGQIAKVFSEMSPNEVRALLDRMLKERQLKPLPGRTMRYQLAESSYRLVRDSWASRFEALNSFMISVHQAINARFLNEDARALVRTIRFRLRQQDRAELEAFYREQLFPLIQELDKRAVQEQSQRTSDSEADNTFPVRLSILWSPDADTLEDEEESQ